MKASELRIGNYVFYRNVETDEWTNDLPIEDGQEIDGADEYEPIPLTEEWLVKLGFEPLIGRVFYSIDVPNNGPFWLEYTDDLTQLFYTIDGEYTIGKNIQYVHQLQNLYFALTGDELILKGNE